MYCPYCGNEVTSAMSYCPYCGAELVSGTGTALTLSSAKAGGEYRLILVSRGTSTQTKTIDLLTDLLGYTETMAEDLYENAPVEIAKGLSAEQAKCLAQAFTEYGIEVSVCDPYGTVTLQNSSGTSLFSSDGNLLASAAAILATITALNRVNSFRRYSRPSLLERLFRLAFRPKEPPRHIRRRIPKYIHEEPGISRLTAAANRFVMRNRLISFHQGLPRHIPQELPTSHPGNGSARCRRKKLLLTADGMRSTEDTSETNPISADPVPRLDRVFFSAGLSLNTAESENCQLCLFLSTCISF